jgi:hypothetical protein
MYLGHFWTRRFWIVIVGMAILCLSTATFVLIRARSHAPFIKDDLYWILD